MIPALSGEQLRALRSRAEARFYEACRDQLPADVVVIHSASWVYRDARGRLREGEADFTILVPQAGVLAVEVKGGGVAFDAGAGRWYSVDREGQRNEIKDPFKQASGERHALLDQLTGHPMWRQWAGTRLTAHFGDRDRSFRDRDRRVRDPDRGSPLGWVARFAV
jgi:hypothetical protein